MRLLVLTTLALIVCRANTVAADPGDSPSVWDRTYKHHGYNGTWPCPDGLEDVVVENGHFSIPWDFKDLNNEGEWFNIGHIDGSVRPSGMTENVTVTMLQPIPRKVRKVLEDANESLDKLREMKVKVKFSGDRKRPRELTVSVDQGMCTAFWAEDRKAALASAPAGAVSCSAAEYAAAPWSAKRAYKVGELTRVATPGQPARLYRCIDECKPGMAPVASAGSTRDEDEDEGVSAAPAGDAWSFFAECEGAVAPDVKLPATGSPKWDTSYVGRSGFSQDWRCPRNLGTIVVSRGKFSIPWRLSTDDASGDNSEDLTVGSLDGVIAADGTTTLRSRFTIDTLPPEVTRLVRLSGAAAMAALRTAVPSMKFVLDVGKMNPSGQGRRAALNFGKGCEYTLEAKDYKPQQFREQDGWRVDCNRDQIWHARTTYNSGDEATVGGAVKHKYRCRSSHCDGRPGSSGQWALDGRCR
jgi:hypothetical protein